MTDLIAMRVGDGIYHLRRPMDGVAPEWWPSVGLIMRHPYEWRVEPRSGWARAFSTYERAFAWAEERL